MKNQLRIVFLSILILSCGAESRPPQTNNTEKKSAKKRKSKPYYTVVFTDGYGCRWIVFNYKLRNRAGADIEHHPTCKNPKHSKTN